MSYTLLPVRVLILDDHVIIRRGLRNLIGLKMPTVQVRDVSTLRDLFSHLRSEPTPQLLVLDLQLTDGNAMEHIAELRTKFPSMRILIYSMNPERIYARRVLDLGCAGYLSKEASEEEVMRALRMVLNGDEYTGWETTMRNLDRPVKDRITLFEQLSQRELLVLDHILTGLSVTDIATKVGLSVSTVGTYKARLFEKLGVSNLLELQSLVNAHGYRRQ